MSLSYLNIFNSFEFPNAPRMKSKVFSNKALQFPPLYSLLPILFCTDCVLALFAFLLFLKYTQNILVSGYLHLLYLFMARYYIICLNCQPSLLD